MHVLIDFLLSARRLSADVNGQTERSRSTSLNDHREGRVGVL